ncbi:glutamine amidotransferase [Microbacterium sp. ASV81]|uniref:Glutamine amidotransferase n=1 Tax=Microbacterium capsulatum TaxID=3041921 RepID=A0ABU0XJ53_9MICO|nr:glutamine amidotransferase [Microbacterium sp. ASV81]MDQ4215171.1 glutamine amidotransferase [Microbacterium sp. ASV81]
MATTADAPQSPAGTRVLLAGESWSTTSVHTKGFDSFFTSSYEEGAWPFIRALEAAGHTVDFLPNHVAADRFPTTLAELSAYDVVVLSDIGANTLLLPASVFSRGRSMPDRLALLAEWVRGGGSLLMVGGYLSFQGIEAKANYRNTALAEVLPVLMEVGDDREETPQGIAPRVLPGHPAVAGLPSELPPILGYQRLLPRPGSEVLMTVDGRPLFIVGSAGEGRTAAFATDMGPHWLPPVFLEWEGFDRIWQSMIGWLAGEDARA